MMILNSKRYLVDTEKIKMERARQCVSVEKLAKKARLDPKTIIRIEKKMVNPRIQTIGSIARALDKDIEEFIEEIEE